MKGENSSFLDAALAVLGRTSPGHNQRARALKFLQATLRGNAPGAKAAAEDERPTGSASDPADPQRSSKH